MRLMTTPSGEKHGLINTIANSVKDNKFEHMSADVKAKAEKLRKDEARIVKARYINYMGEHERLTKPYCRWAGDHIHTFHFIPNNEYEVPYGLVKEVNENPGLAQRSEIVDSEGVPTKKDGKAKKIHEFIPIGF